MIITSSTHRTLDLAGRDGSALHGFQSRLVFGTVQLLVFSTTLHWAAHGM